MPTDFNHSSVTKEKTNSAHDLLDIQNFNCEHYDVKKHRSACCQFFHFIKYKQIKTH